MGARSGFVGRGRGRIWARARWRERPVLGAAVRLTALVLPVAAAAVVSAEIAGRLPLWPGARGVALRIGILLAVSAVVLLAVERAARRLIPLGILFQLSMSFPDHAPSRIRVAARAGGIRDLERQIDTARASGVDDEPMHAAERIITLMATLAAHDRRTRGHSERVRILADLLADELHLSQADRDRLRWAALLHDIGKLHLDADLLNKDGKPSADEWDLIFRHPAEGARLAAPLAGWLGPWAATIAQHHERYDGTGYPNRLLGREISYGARIVAVADAYERMTSRASYARPLSPVAAREELTRCAGTQFDPVMVRAFLNISIGRLWWRTGPLSFLVQIPLLAWLPRLAGGLSPVGGAIGAATGAAAGAAAVAITGLLVAPAPVLVARVPLTAVPAPAPQVLAATVDRSAPMGLDIDGGFDALAAQTAPSDDSSVAPSPDPAATPASPPPAVAPQVVMPDASPLVVLTESPVIGALAWAAPSIPIPDPLTLVGVQTLSP